ncbi:hypothetical protein BGZ94_006518, partial [Podila epigama]
GTKKIWNGMQNNIDDVKTLRKERRARDDSESETTDESDVSVEEHDISSSDDSDTVVEMPGKMWNVRELYKGIMPLELVQGWRGVYGTTETVARYMMDVFARSVEEFGRE